jgi:uncharacterized membrane protein YphA (DoxX/SURF4 family)
MKIPFLLGRLVFGGFFLYNGINHIRERRMMAQYAAVKKVPLPEAAVTASGILIMLGGASVILGLQPRYGAAAIIAFLAGVSPTMHDFWRVEDPGRRASETINFSKNMALLGAALSLAALEEPWPASIPTAEPGRCARLQALSRRLLNRW